jgi:hypothetical protein
MGTCAWLMRFTVGDEVKSIRALKRYNVVTF